jgi:hypothetical protein
MTSYAMFLPFDVCSIDNSQLHLTELRALLHSSTSTNINMAAIPCVDDVSIATTYDCYHD